jgi:hypothetical protein
MKGIDHQEITQLLILLKVFRQKVRATHDLGGKDDERIPP